MRCAGWIPLSALLCWPLGPLVAAQDEVFKDWRVTCVGTPSQCQMTLSQSVAEGEGDVFLLSITKGKGTEAGNAAVITVPLGVYLAHGGEIHIPGQRAFKVAFEICDQTSCHAGFQLKGAALRAFRQGLDAKFRVWTARSKAVEFSVSLRGFSDALADLQARGAE